MLMVELNKRLRELRKAHQLTQQDVASFLGITESAYGFYEQGRNEPSLSKLKQLAEIYHVSIAYIAGETEEKSVPLYHVNEQAQHYYFKDLDIEEQEFLEEQLKLFRKMRRNRRCGSPNENKFI